MTIYRLVWLDNKGNVPKSAQIECRTDREAIGVAERQTGEYEVIDIWEGSRPVCRCGNPHKTKKD
jgi:hypothetical protein